MNKGSSVDEILEAAGFEYLDKEATDKMIESALRELAEQVNGSDRLRREIVRKAAIEHLTEAVVKAPTRLVDAALGTGGDSRDDVGFDKQEITPWGVAVDGEQVLRARRGQPENHFRAAAVR